MVVVGVDGSLEATEAARYAAQAADERRLDLLVVHAFALPLSAVGVPYRRLGALAKVAAQRVADDTLTQVRMPVGLHVHTEVAQTTPGAMLLRLSRAAAIVTIGQHVFDLADQLIEGSVAGPLAAAAGCPVVVVPRDWSRVTRRGPTVAVALDGTASAEAVLVFAFDEAERHQSPVLALHVVSRVEDPEAATADLANLKEILAAAKESHPDLTVSVTLVAGDLAQAVLEASRGARLMVVGRSHGTARTSTRGSSATQAVLAAAHCPLVVVA